MLACMQAQLYKHANTVKVHLNFADLRRPQAAGVKPAHEAEALDGTAFLRAASVHTMPVARAATALCSSYPLRSPDVLRRAGG